ncbi:MAG: ABC transporter permease [Bacteroidetes bacterium]|nr:ABC transporter permease [Bacteroidota bacterium]
MGKYIAKRFISMLITLLVIVTITFFLMHAVPGDPFSLPRETPPEVRANLEAKYGLDKPLFQQYVIYLGNLVKGDFGISMKYKGQSVIGKVADGMPESFIIGFGGVIIGGIVGMILGIFAALKRGRGFDYFIILLAIIGVSVPNFVFGSLLQFIFGVKARILPVAGWGSMKFIILPIAAATMQNVAFYARMLRTSMLDVLNQDYISTAVSKGLSRGEVIRKHVLRNSILPLVTSLGPMLAGVLMGNFVIEKIFNIPGIGQAFIIAIQNTDYTMIMGLTVIFSTITVMLYFIVDILYGVVDPRIKVQA